MGWGAGWFRRHYRTVNVMLLAVFGIIVGGLGGTPWWTTLDGPLFDSGVAARWYASNKETPVSPHVAVVGVDWATLNDPTVSRYPRSLFGPFWGQTLDALLDAGAKVVVFDMIFNYSGNALLPDHDRPFFQALAKGRGRVVLGRTGDTTPARPFQVAVGATPANGAMALTEMIADADGVVRTLRQSFTTGDGADYVTLSGAALSRLGVPLPKEPIRFLPTGPLELTFPTYSMIEVIKSAGSPEGQATLKAIFGGKVVFVGTVVIEEDRKGSPDRFLLTSGATPVASDGLPRLGISGPRSATVPGVYLHASAIAAALDPSRALVSAPAWVAALTLGAALGVVALAGVSLPLSLAAGIAAGVAAALVGLSWALPVWTGWMLPVGISLVLVLLAVPVAFGVRYVFEERRRAMLQQAFGHYVAPAVVARMAKEDAPPKLGGEDRELTCMFADLSGFTALSTQVSAAELVHITNRYLDLITAEIDATGGYVDKFIGDAVMALWNAPAEYHDHPVRAVRAALAAAQKVADEKARANSQGLPGFSIKIGLNTGPAVVGNMGAARRFNYTAVGEAVNIAARLEPLPGLYRCAVIVSEATALRCQQDLPLCQIDMVRVKGKDEPLRLFLPLAFAWPAADSPEAAALTEWLERWSAAFELYRAGDFRAAEAALRLMPQPPLPPLNVDSEDGCFSPAVVLADRCVGFLEKPPASWDGVSRVGKA